MKRGDLLARVVDLRPGRVAVFDNWHTRRLSRREHHVFVVLGDQREREFNRESQRVNSQR